MVDIKARMKCYSVEDLGATPPLTKVVKLQPFYDADPDSPNHSFAPLVAPSGDFVLHITNAETAKLFGVGKMFDVALTEYTAPETAEQAAKREADARAQEERDEATRKAAVEKGDADQQERDRAHRAAQIESERHDNDPRSPPAPNDGGLTTGNDGLAKTTNNPPGTPRNA